MQSGHSSGTADESKLKPSALESSLENAVELGANTASKAIPCITGNRESDGVKNTGHLQPETNRTVSETEPGHKSIITSDMKTNPAVSSDKDTNTVPVFSSDKTEESNPTFLGSEFGNVGAPSTSIKTQPDSELGEANLTLGNKKPSTSSSEHEDHFQLGLNAPNNPATGTAGVNVGSKPTTESTTIYPPVQEKPSDPSHLKPTFGDTKANLTFLGSEFGNGGPPGSSLKHQPAFEFLDLNLTLGNKNSDTYSFSSSSATESETDPVLLDTDALNKTVKNVPGLHVDSITGSEPATQYPPTQMMERQDDPTSSEYRIPEHVFSRTKSTAPMEWSVCSNESLFSIHVGNMSFSRDQMFLKSFGDQSPLFSLENTGESGMPFDSGSYLSNESSNDPPGVSPLVEPYFNHPAMAKPNDIAPKTVPFGEGSMVTETTAFETMREVIRDSENQHKEDASRVREWSGNLSDESTKSFAFPLLIGDGDKNASVKGGRGEKQKQHPELQPKLDKEKVPDTTPASKANSNLVPVRWFSCFGCRSFCS